ncbi:MAG: hypothetical protein GC147_04670 [Porphyrobacter sp.]|nr:hypothetical protein [Porphyrobacter sp.]
MLRKIIGAALGAKLAGQAPAKGGAAGALAASALPFVLSRVALPGLAAIGVGAFVLGRYRDRRKAGGDSASEG